MPVHTLHTEETLVILRYGGQPHKRTTDYGVDFFGKRNDIRAHAKPCRATADVNIRLFRLVNQLDCLVDKAFFYFRQGDFFHDGLWLVFILRHLHVLGNVDEDRPRSARFRYRKRLAQGVRQILDFINEIIMLGNGQGYARNIDFLKAVFSDKRTRHVARNRHHRDTIQHCRGNTRNEVGRAWTARRDTYAYLARRAGIPVRSVRRALLVRRQYVIDFILVLVQRVVDIDNLTAGIPEYVGYALLNQGLN